MSDAAKLLASVKLGEGYRGAPYLDTTGHYTIGNGTNLEAEPPTGAQWRWLLEHHAISVGLSTAGADYLTEQSLATAEDDCSRQWRWWSTLNDARQNVLIEMVFEMGLSKVLAFHDMLDALARGDFADAAAEMLDSTWARQVGNRATRLATQMRTGAFP